MKINPLANGFNYQIARQVTPNHQQSPIQRQSNNGVETAGTVGVTASEIFGRSQVNFCAIKKTPEFQLSKEDENFVSGVANVFRLDKEQAKELRQMTIDFIKDAKVRTIADMESDDFTEFANEQAGFSDRVTYAFGLTDDETTTLIMLLNHQTHIGDITKPMKSTGHSVVEANKYAKDFTPYDYIMKPYLSEDDNQYTGFQIINRFAKTIGAKTAFDIFKQENIELGKQAVEELSSLYNLSKAEADDLILDFVVCAKKDEKARLDGINIHETKEKFEDGITSIVIANAIAKEYGFKPDLKLLEMVDKRRTNTEANKNSQSNAEVAYHIAEEYNLSGAKKIIEILESYSTASRKEIGDNLIKALQEEEEEKLLSDELDLNSIDPKALDNLWNELFPPEED